MIEAVFTGNEPVLYLQIKSWQYDTGQTLCVSGLSGINASTEVHFERKLCGDAVVKTGEYDSENGTLTVDIPDVFFEYADGTPGRVWIYPRVSDDEGKTVREINIPIAERERPDDYISQDDLSRGDALSAAVGNYIERNEQIIDEAVSDYIDAHPVATVGTNNIVDGAVTPSKLSSEVTAEIAAKADADSVYTKAETDARIAAAAPSDIGGYVEDYLDEHSELFTGYTKAEADSTFKTNVQADIDHSVLNTRIGNINRNISTINDNINNRYTKSETDALIAAAIQTAIGGVENGSY
ncbi:MAG: hypothetical protein UIH27_10935 [Ruminococcus sp.]|nr:hypothetical protein [Ruminococcus sp.]